MYPYIFKANKRLLNTRFFMKNIGSRVELYTISILRNNMATKNSVCMKYHFSLSEMMYFSDEDPLRVETLSLIKLKDIFIHCIHILVSWLCLINSYNIYISTTSRGIYLKSDTCSVNLASESSRARAGAPFNIY